ncbi:hypothetical protein D3C81_1514160 [compost metagenome]
MIILDKMIIIHASTRTNPTMYIGYLNTRKFIIGSRIAFCLNANITSAISPMIMENTTTVLVQPPSPSPALLKPYTTPPNPIVESMTDSKSMRDFVTSVTFSKYFSPTNNPTIKNGSDSQKI